MKEFRIYVENKLVSICYSEYSLMNNLSRYRKVHGNKVKLKSFDVIVNDNEKKEWLNDLELK